MRVHTKRIRNIQRKANILQSLWFQPLALRDEEIFVTNDRGHFILEKKDSGYSVFFVTQSRLKAAYVNPDPARENKGI